MARLRGTGARKPLLLLAHLDVVEARREDWTTDPFTLVEKDGYFYGRGTSDDKAMAAIFVANADPAASGGLKPDRDIILALTADEELASSPYNGVRWLLENHRDLIDAEFALNEGGGGEMTRRPAPRSTACRRARRSSELPSRGHESRRPQLAAAQGQRHLPARRGPRAAAAPSSFRSR